MSKLAKMESEEFLKCAFIIGLPNDFSNQLRAAAEISKTTITLLLQQARILMPMIGLSYPRRSNKKNGKLLRGNRSSIYSNGGRLQIRCYAGVPVIRVCSNVQRFSCHKKSHMANDGIISRKEGLNG